jgi:hypothetical protein
MSLPRTVAEILRDHVTLEVENIDRMYLNLYVPILQREAGVAWFFREHRGAPFPSAALMAPMTRAFVAALERFAEEQEIPLIQFEKGRRKDDVAKEYLRGFRKEEGVMFIGKAQEKVPVVRTVRKVNPETGKTYPWLSRSSAMVNQYYIYGVDRDFGPFFVKFCSYFPYNGKVYLNGHEYLKRQLEQKGIAYEALDNGILSCEEENRLRQICAGLTYHRIQRFVRKWLRLLPHPFEPKDRRAGFDYDISILQAEFSLTQVLDRPQTGRVFFEQVIRENLDLGRPDQVQLIFDRRVTRRTPGRFRTRVLTRGVIPSLHVDYKHCRIKQYHKEGRALRTETIINDTRDFKIGRRLHNLPALQEVGFRANRRLLSVQRLGQDCWMGEDAFERVHRPQEVQGQRVPALRFGDTRVLGLFAALLVFRILPRGFSNRDLREHLAPLLGLQPAEFSPGRMTYDLRRLRLHGFIERIPKSHRYQITEFGFQAAVFLSRAYARLLRPGMATVAGTSDDHPGLRRALTRLDETIDTIRRAAA